MSKPETAHAPLPWHQGGINGQELMAPSVIFAADGAAVAQFYGIPLNCKLDEVDRRRYAEGLENVTAVLQSVNSHSALMEAARTIQIISRGRTATENRSEDALERIIKQARTALAELEKGGIL